jgi:CDP-diacylglycerol--glycerol-3-phosphate 3-phosphatidyltransferase
MWPSSLVFLSIVAGLALSSMVVYAVTGRRPDPDAERRDSHFLQGAGDFLLHWFLWVVSPLDKLSLALGLGPDAFNFAGLALGLAAGFAIGFGRLELGGWAIALGGVCDIMDGRMARLRGMASRYGMFIDSTFDRFVEVAALLGFTVYLRHFAAGPFVAAAALAGSLLVSYTRARGESVGVLCKEGLMQRAERLLLMFFACVSDAHVSAWRGWPEGTVSLWTLALIAVGTMATAVHRTVWIARRLRRE